MPRLRQTSSRGSAYRMRGIHGRVIGSIGEGIIKGRYPPGSLLPREPELIAKFGVSRTALREALKVLAAKGLVETRQPGGTRPRIRKAHHRTPVTPPPPMPSSPL